MSTVSWCNTFRLSLTFQSHAARSTLQRGGGESVTQVLFPQHVNIFSDVSQDSSWPRENTISS